MVNKLCALCNVKDKVWLEQGFFGIEKCDTCNIPIITLEKHKSKLNKKEEKIFEDLIEKYYPGYKGRGIGMRSIPDHWHEHMVAKEDIKYE